MSEFYVKHSNLVFTHLCASVTEFFNSVQLDHSIMKFICIFM
jgi:hypothetical protein